MTLEATERAPYLVTWDLPLIMEGFGITTEALEPLKQMLVQGLAGLVPDASILIVDSKELKSKAESLLDKAKRRFTQAPVISMDWAYFPIADARINITRLLDWDTRFEKKPVRSPGARPGYLPLVDQVQALSKEGATGVILADAGVFDGGTFSLIEQELKKQNISVDAFVGAVASPTAPSLHGRKKCGTFYGITA